MEPISLGIALSAAAHTAFSKVNWSTVSENLAKQAATSTGKGLWSRLKNSKEQLDLARKAVALYVEQFTKELENTTILEAALPGYLEQLATFAGMCAPELADCVHPDAQEPNQALLRRLWTEMGLDPLPAEFDWEFVGKNFLREIRKLIRATTSLREQLAVVLQERQLETSERLLTAVESLKPLDTPIDTEAYRTFVQNFCSTLQLAIMHSSTYNYSKTLNLWNIFIAPSAREAIPVPDLPIITLTRLREEGYISEVPTEQELQMMRQTYESSSSGPVVDALKRENRSVIVGDPGAGKSSLLKYLALEWVFRNSDLTPLLVDLREYIQDHSQFIRFVAKRTHTFGFTSKAIHDLLQSGHAALYLDGLDEVLDRSARSAVTESIVAFSARYPRARIVVTSRISGYEPELLRAAGFVHLTLENLGANDIDLFLDRWYKLAEEDLEIRTRNITRLKRAIARSRPIRELAGNPLLLTMMAILNRNQDLPRDRVELYREAARVLLHELDASRLIGVETFARQEKEELLRELAGKMQELPEGLTANSVSRKELLQLITRLFTKYGIANPYVKANALLQQLTDRNFILCPAGAGRFSFVHRTFLEYFCASWIIERLQVDQTLQFEELRDNIFALRWQDESWHEVLRLIAGMVSDRQANELIQFLMTLPGRENQYANLLLAAGCLSELRNRRVIHETETALKRLVIDKAIRYEPPYYYELYSEWLEVGPARHRAVRVLYSTWPDGETEAWLKKAAESDKDWIVRQVAIQEYSRIPNGKENKREWLETRLAQETKAAVRRSALQEIALHGRSAPSTFEYLVHVAETDRQMTVRQAAIQEIARGWKGSEAALSFLKRRAEEDRDLFARQAALQEVARGWKQDPDTLTWLMEHAEDGHAAQLQFSAVQEFARGWAANNDMHKWLMAKATSGTSMARQAALQELVRAWKQHPQTYLLLMQVAEKDVDQEVRRTCIRCLSLGWIEDATVREFIKSRSWNDESRLVKVHAIQQLARVGAALMDVPSFLQEYAVSHVSPSSRRAAILELARGWGRQPELVAWLKQFLEGDAPDNVRSGALLALARIGLGRDETLSWLLVIARSSTTETLQKTAVAELSQNWKASFPCEEFLVELAESASSYRVRNICVEELAEAEPWSMEARRALERAAHDDPHPNVRRVALVKLLRDSENDIERTKAILDQSRIDPSRKVRKAVVSWMKQHPSFESRYEPLLVGMSTN